MRVLRAAVGLLLVSTFVLLGVEHGPPAITSPVGIALTSTTDSSVSILVLGDSYSSGNGAGSYDTSGCFRSAHNYAERFATILANRFGQAATVTDQACSGATSNDFAQAQNAQTGPQLDSVDATYDEIFLTIEGDDLGFPDIVRDCLVTVTALRSTCRSDLNVTDHYIAVGNARTDIRLVLSQIHGRAAPTAQIVLLGYPYLEGDPNLKFGRIPLGKRIRDLGDELEAIQTNTVNRLNKHFGAHQFVFVSTQRLFAGKSSWLPPKRQRNHELFKARENAHRWLLQSPWDVAQTAEYYHPSPRGWHEEAELLAHSKMVLRRKLAYGGGDRSFSATVTEPFSASIGQIAGGVRPFSVAFDQSAPVPPWLSVSWKKGRLRLGGTPDRAGTWASVIDVSDQTGRTVAVNATITSTFPVGKTLCTTQTVVPRIECRALVAMYKSTNGPSWVDNTNWDASIRICSWKGIWCNHGRHVRQIQLGNNDLSGPLPAQLGNLTGMKWLRLGGNQLTIVPSQIGNLANLEWLQLDGNDIATLPSSLWTLAKLNVLYLGSNPLGSVDPGVGNLKNLTFLSLDSDQLSSLPRQLGNLPNLFELDVEDNQLTGLPRNLRHLPLYQLDASYNQFAQIPSWVTTESLLDDLDFTHNQLISVPTSIGNLTRLTRLGLAWNQLTAVPAEVGSLPNLQTLDVSGNLLTGDISPWAKPLSSDVNLQSLTIRDGAGFNNCLTVGGHTALAAWLTSMDALWNECS